MTREEEIKLIKKAQRGDIAAFEELVKTHENYVYRLALGTLRSPEDARDAAQEVFIKVWNSLGTFRGESKLSVWLYRITGNVCLDMLRKRRGDVVGLSFTDEEGTETEMDIADTAPGPQELLEEKERSASLKEALAALPEEYRSAFILRESAGMSYTEISALLKIDIGTVKSRIFRARKKTLQNSFRRRELF